MTPIPFNLITHLSIWRVGDESESLKSKQFTAWSGHQSEITARFELNSRYTISSALLRCLCRCGCYVRSSCRRSCAPLHCKTAGKHCCYVNRPIERSTDFKIVCLFHYILFSACVSRRVNRIAETHCSQRANERTNNKLTRVF